jgi:hypothetical protein
MKMSRTILFALTLAVMFLTTVTCPANSSATEPLPILFLGGKSHHQPEQLYLVLRPALEKQGIELTYTEDMTILTSDKLQSYSGLLVYANTEKITPEQEAGLVHFVENGKGFIPIHCASYCFLNSDKYIALVGAQFHKHGMKQFSVINAAPAHPIMQGFDGFKSWDETYVHDKHNEVNRIILEYRAGDEQAAGQNKEPWTWVRTQGKGRIFYTAWGHDQRTWNQPGFQNLITRGILWACGKDPQQAGAYHNAERQPFQGTEMTMLATDVKPIEYIDVGPKIPVYVSDAKWGTQNAPQTLLPLPLSPEESLKHYAVPQGFSLKLYASEKDFESKPIAMNWDERGRLWICETLDYPNELQEPGQGRDRIKICVDTDHDGVADNFTEFATGLSIPTAIVCTRGGVIVQNAIETLFLKDTDGDDKADVKKVLISGWGCIDTHGGVSNFQLGHDNWIWGMQGYNPSKPVAEGVTYPEFRQGYFRFKLDHSDPPKVTQIEFMKSCYGNTWGLGFTEEGLAFSSSANRFPSLYMPIPNRYYERVKGWKADHLIASAIFDKPNFAPITDKVRQVDHHGMYTAACGHAMYTARRYPQNWWNQTGFVCGPTGHLVGIFAIEPIGIDFRSTSPSNLVASNDEWSAPIMAEVGPDGNVWILDWYNYIVQHNPTPHGFETGKGRAYESDLRDKKHGRILRLEYPTTEKVRTQLDKQNVQDLLAGLNDNNMFWRKHAQFLLIERGNHDVVPVLLQMLEHKQVDTIGFNAAAFHAVWTLDGLGVVSAQNPAVMQALKTALKHPSAGVRRAVLQVLPSSPESIMAMQEQQVLNDADAQVQLAAILAYADQAPHLAAGPALYELARTLKLSQGTWLQDAVISACATHAESFLHTALQKLKSTDPAPDTTFLQVTSIVAEHLIRSQPDHAQISQLFSMMPQASPALTNSIMNGFQNGWPRNSDLSISSEGQVALLKLVQTGDVDSKVKAMQLANLAGMKKEVAAYTDSMANELLEHLANPDVSEDGRILAITQLAFLKPNDETVTTRLVEAITPKASLRSVNAIFDVLRKSTAKNISTEILAHFNSWTPDSKKQAIGTLLSRIETTHELLQAIEQGKLDSGDLRLDQWQALRTHSDPAIRNQAVELMKKSGGLPNADREIVVQQMTKLIAEKGHVEAGKVVFKKQCAKCHKHTGDGENIGPDLTSMAVHPKMEMLVNIMDPSRSVEANFRSYTVLTADGRTRTGMLTAESQTSIEIVDTEARKETILREDILELTASQKSLMPEGFEKQMTTTEIRDLLEFLAAKGKYLPLPLNKVATAVSTRSLFSNNPNDDGPDRLVLPIWEPVKVEGVPFVLVHPQGKRNPNIILLHGPNGPLPPKMPESVQIPCHTPAMAIHLLSGVGGWSFPASKTESVSMIVRLHYADGTKEDHPLLNGVHFADYIKRVDVPESKFAFMCQGQQMRYLSIKPLQQQLIHVIEFIKGPDSTAPIIMGVTIETPQK